MRRYLLIASALGSFLGTAGCDDGFLTTEPQDVISDATYWQSERDFTLAVNAVYRNVISTDRLYLEGATDLMYSQKDWTQNHEYAQGHQHALSGWSGNLWGSMYQGISRANEVLEQLETTDAPLSETARSRIEAQARFLRGYYYHELLWMFGGVPLFTSVPTVTEAREATRASRDEVIDFVLADFAAAAEGLPESWPASDNGRARRGTALAYLARAALYEASWNKYQENDMARANQLFQRAADASKAVIDSGRFSLHPNFRELFMYAGEGSPEVIFDYQRVKGVNGWSAWSLLAPHSMGGNIDLSPTRTTVDAFRMIDGLPIDESPLYDPSPPVINGDQVVSLGMYANRDPRLYGSVIFPGAQFNGEVYNSFPGSGTPDQVVTSNMSNTHTGYVTLKYVDPADEADQFNSGINFILMRFADVLLMYAEAKIELNQIDGSVKAALDQLRDRVDMPSVTLGTQAEMIDLVRNERVVELAFEGHRLADIRRWKIAEDVMPGNVSGVDVREGSNVVTLRGLWQRTFADPRDYLWPIPATERDLNPALEQNPGY